MKKLIALAMLMGSASPAVAQMQQLGDSNCVSYTNSRWLGQSFRTGLTSMAVDTVHWKFSRDSQSACPQTTGGIQYLDIYEMNGDTLTKLAGSTGVTGLPGGMKRAIFGGIQLQANRTYALVIRPGGSANFEVAGSHASNGSGFHVSYTWGAAKPDTIVKRHVPGNPAQKFDLWYRVAGRAGAFLEQPADADCIRHTKAMPLGQRYQTGAAPMTLMRIRYKQTRTNDVQCGTIAAPMSQNLHVFEISGNTLGRLVAQAAWWGRASDGTGDYEATFGASGVQLAANTTYAFVWVPGGEANIDYAGKKDPDGMGFHVSGAVAEGANVTPGQGGVAFNLWFKVM